MGDHLMPQISRMQAVRHQGLLNGGNPWLKPGGSVQVEDGKRILLCRFADHLHIIQKNASIILPSVIFAQAVQGRDDQDRFPRIKAHQRGKQGVERSLKSVRSSVGIAAKGRVSMAEVISAAKNDDCICAHIHFFRSLAEVLVEGTAFGRLLLTGDSGANDPIIPAIRPCFLSDQGDKALFRTVCSAAIGDTVPQKVDSGMR